MRLTREELGRALSRELDKGYDPIRIARWAYLLHLDTRENDPGVDSELSDLMVMEQGPEFVMSEKELRELAHTLQDLSRLASCRHMKLDDFRLLDREARRTRPKIFMLAAPDPPAAEEALAELEKAIGIALPPSYRGFLAEFGGGDYGLATVFSADPESEWYLAAQLDEARAYLPAGLLPFSDDGAGGMYVLRVSDGRAEEPVMYWHEDGGLVATRFGDVLDFVARYAFE